MTYMFLFCRDQVCDFLPAPSNDAFIDGAEAFGFGSAGFFGLRASRFPRC